MRSCGWKWLKGFGEELSRRKVVDNEYMVDHGLVKSLGVVDLVGIGVGTTIGAGVYILIGNVGKEHTGPALPIAFLIAGIAAALSAFCYAELSCRCPSAGSAYHYSYICIGEWVAWMIGWALILEYAVGGSVVARGVTPNLALFFGGYGNLPGFLSQHTLFGIVVDPCAAVLVIVATLLTCCGVKESSVVQTVVTTINVCALWFVILAGGYLAFKNDWPGYKLSNGYFPFGFNGVFAGSATVFFSYIGFDTVTATAEEVKNPKRDLPWGIGISLALSCVLYMLLSFVIVGLVPYYELDVDTPISTAFSKNGIEWAASIITTGAVMALLASLMGSLLPQSRILMVMSRDGLLPSFFSNIDRHTHVPVKGTLATGVLAAALACVMDVSELAGMVSVGTLLAFSAVAVSVLIIRYAPPEEILPKSSFVESLSPMGRHRHDMPEINDSLMKGPFILAEDDSQDVLEKRGKLHDQPADGEPFLEQLRSQWVRNMAKFFIGIICVAVVVLTSAASAESIPRLARFVICGIGATVLLTGMSGLAYIGQDVAAEKFGHTGGFICPFVPYLPTASLLINTYLLVNLGAATWIRSSIWLLLGALVYICYGRTHSLLSKSANVFVHIAADVDIVSPRRPTLETRLIKQV